MTYLPSLIKRIDDFYSLVTSFPRLKALAQNWQTAYMPDDEGDEPEGGGGQALPGDEWVGLYPNIIGVAESLSNEKNDFKYEDIAHELQLIAELYKKALEINGGYHQMQEYIKRTMANIDMMIDESEGFIGDEVRDMSDDILEEVSSDLRKRAKTPVTQQADEAAATRELKTIRDNFNRQEARQEMESQKSVYEKGKPGAETGHGIAARATPETPEKYAREVARLRQSLETETDPKTKASIEELGNTLVDLISKMKVTKEAEDAVKITPDDEGAQKRYKQATEDLERLRYQRKVLKSRLNKFLLDKDQEELQSQLVTVRNPMERKWIEEKIKLLQLRQSNDLRKRDEIKARKTLINSMGVIDDHGDFQSLNIPENEMIAFLRGIQLGETQKLTKADYDRTQSIERAKSHGKIGDVGTKLPGQRGGGLSGEKQQQPQRREQLYDIGLATFEGLVDKLGEKINTAAHVARLNVTQDKKTKLHNELKPLTETISQAIQNAGKIKKNLAKETVPAKREKLQQLWITEHQKRYEAVKQLQSRIKADVAQWADRARAGEALGKNVIWLPHFIKAKNILEKIATWKKDTGWQLDEGQQSFITEAITSINKLLNRYDLFYGGAARKRGVIPLEMSFESAAQYLRLVLFSLSKETGIFGSEVPADVKFRVPTESTRVSPTSNEEATEEEEGPNKALKQMKLSEKSMTKKRISILQQIIEEDKLLKLGQETGTNEGAVEAASADKMAEEIFNKLFDEALVENGLKTSQS